ncbi:MAG: hypothetical protein GYA43_09770 [Bacteroidales bacterium]|nr:hypothetical protein [Bacteroidales bacterium]
MKPDRNNYESWIIDYLDGKLNSRETRLLMEFLDNNPDLKEDLESLKMVVLEPAGEVYQNKQLLARDLNDLPDDQFGILCIGHMEGDLSSEQEEELQQIIAENPERKHSFELTGKLRLTPPAGGYKYKKRLRRLTTGARVFRLTAAIMSTAAAITVFLVWLFPSQKSGPGTMAVNNPEIDLNPLTIERPAPLIEEPVKTSEETASQKSAPVANETTGMQLRNAEDINISFASYKENVPVVPGYAPTLSAVKPSETALLLTEAESEPGGLRLALRGFVREKILRSEKNTGEELKPYEIAGAGISGLNTLLGWQMALNQTVGESGEVVAVNFNSKLLKFNLPVKKSE